MRGDEIDRALACAQTGDFEQARAILKAAQRDRTRAMVKARHDMGNALSIAQSSIEAMLDAVAEVDSRRLERLLEIIKDVSAALYEVTADARPD